MGSNNFKKYKLLSTPWFNIYFYKTLEGNDEVHLHNHAWDYYMIILKGECVEHSFDGQKKYGFLDVIRHKSCHFHQIEVTKSPLWCLVITSKENRRVFS